MTSAAVHERPPDIPVLSTDQEGALFDRCRRGEPGAWHELFDAHFDFVRRLSRRLGTPDSELDDVSQEVFAIVFRRLDSFRDGRFTTWLFRIVSNVVSHRHRKQRIRSLLGELLGRQGARLSAEDPQRHLERRELAERARRILERMSAKKREVFVLYELEGCSGEEIAERVGCPVETVRTRLFHARKDFARLSEVLP